MDDAAGRIVVSGLTKRFGRVTAVDGLSFTAGPGLVTGFLGPNGARKDHDAADAGRLVVAVARRGLAGLGGRAESGIGTVRRAGL